MVEHQGSLRSGHYTARVKVRPGAGVAAGAAAAHAQTPPPPSAANAYERFYSSPAPKTDDIRELQAEIERNCREKDGGGLGAENGSSCSSSAAAVPQAKWYYISDTHVSEVSEDKVLRSQAYLLFYERVE